MMEKHLHQHPLILTSEGVFLNKFDIYEASVQEIYTFCHTNSLISLWQYLWTEWYKNVVIHQKRKFQQINLGREKPDWNKDFII